MRLQAVLTRAAAHVDSAIGLAMLNGRSRTSARAEALGPAERMVRLAEIAALYDRPEHYEPGGGFFADPPAIVPTTRQVRTIRGGRVVDLVWPSSFEPLCADVAAQYLEHEPNRSAAARLFLHDDRPRPAALLVHGYRCGQWALEERVWPVDWLFSRGLDVALVVLPFHAVRARRGPPLFPSSDPRVTTEGFRQAMLDLRALVRHLVDRGAPAVGAMGMSLGGYTTSLLATVEALAFAVPIIPLASFAEAAREQGRLVGEPEEQRAQLEAIRRAFRAVSPVSRRSKVAPDRVLVIGAEGDRITPISHAKELAAHFAAPLETMHGGHLLQFGRGDAFRSVARMLGRLDLLEPQR